MSPLLRDIDLLLRGGFTRREDLSTGRIEVPVRTLFLANLILGAQMAWVLRLFIGSPNMPTHFFREGAWSNAYVVVTDSLWKFLQGR